MKRIWFTQQKPFGYAPLRAGLGLISVEELREYGIFNGTACKEAILKTHQQTCKSLSDFGYNPEMLCPKIYTTRTHRLSGEYVVVEGSRFKARPVEPKIKFKARCVGEFTIRTFDSGNTIHLFIGKEHSFPELDLGFKGATFNMLSNELLRLNKNSTIDTGFHVNLLEPIETRKVA